MFNLFGDSTFGQAANNALNTGVGSSPVGSLAEYMNNVYGKGNDYNIKGVKLNDEEGAGPSQLPNAAQSLSQLQGAPAGGQPTGMSAEQGMQMASMLIALL